MIVLGASAGSNWGPASQLRACFVPGVWAIISAMCWELYEKDPILEARFWSHVGFSRMNLTMIVIYIYWFIRLKFVKQIMHINILLIYIIYGCLYVTLFLGFMMGSFWTLTKRQGIVCRWTRRASAVTAT